MSTLPQRALILVAAILSCLAVAARVTPTNSEQATSPRPAPTVVLAASVLSSMGSLFTRYNEHWDELGEMNTLEQMLGTGGPTQREYMGCLQGEVARDTAWVRGWQPARGLKQLQFAVSGSCNGIADVIGSWHTHPFRADASGGLRKERGLSPVDLVSLARGPDRVVVAVWDVDSLDAAVRTNDGRVSHPVNLVVR